MKTSIQWKMVSIYLCVVLIIMIVSGSFIIYNIEEKQYQSMQEDLGRIGLQIEETLGMGGAFNLTQNVEVMEERLQKVVALNNAQIYVLGADGRVLLGTASEHLVGAVVGSEIVIQALVTKESAHSGWSHFNSGGLSARKLEHVRPIYRNDRNNRSDMKEMIGMIYIAADATEIHDNIRSVMATMSMGVIIAMLIAGVFGIAFSQMITVPIKQLTRSAKQLVAGSFQRIPIYSYDEIGQLTQSFNHMATELSRTLGDISSEKSKLEKILENMADGVMAFNRQGVLIHANPICYEMLGTTNMDHRFDFIFPKLGVDVSFDKLIVGEEKETSTMLVLEERYFQLYFASYTNVLGEGEGLIVVMQDVTTQQKLDQMRKEFVANVSHELRTPLTTVKSYTETLMDGAIEDKELAQSFLEVMNKETDRMTKLVQDLLELSRMDNSQLQLDFSKVQLERLAKDTLEAQKLQANEKGHKLVLEFDENKCYTILADPSRIRQVLHNIVSNAIKYTPDPGVITVKLFKHDEVVLQVQDTGLGIPKQDIHRIFERFYRVDKARSRKMGGTGLGLSIAKEIVELHGGRIKINSKVGKGTIVTLYLPAYKKE
jgi:two-component system sensor histidine kinase VicK